MSNPGEFWTEPRIEWLRALIETGRTSGEAARIIGCTRNAAIGKAYRLGLLYRRVIPPADKAFLIVQQKRFRAMGWRLNLACRALASIKPTAPWRHPNLCREWTCRNTKQPGRDYCASHITAARAA